MGVAQTILERPFHMAAKVVDLWRTDTASTYLALYIKIHTNPLML